MKTHYSETSTLETFFKGGCELVSDDDSTIPFTCSCELTV